MMLILFLQNLCFALSLRAGFVISTTSAIEDWNVSQVNNMEKLFYNKNNCSPNIERWDVSNVTNFVSDDDVPILFLELLEGFLNVLL